MGGGRDSTDLVSNVPASCEAHPFGKDGRVPRVGGHSLWVCARTVTGVQPAIKLVAGGMGKQGCCEVNDPTLRSATRDMKREKKKSSVVQKPTSGSGFPKTKTYMYNDFKKKVVTRK